MWLLSSCHGLQQIKQISENPSTQSMPSDTILLGCIFVFYVTPTKLPQSTTPSDIPLHWLIHPQPHRTRPSIADHLGRSQEPSRSYRHRHSPSPPTVGQYPRPLGYTQSRLSLQASSIRLVRLQCLFSRLEQIFTNQTTLHLFNGEVADETNPCIAMIMGNAFQKNQTLIYDQILRRDEKSEDLI